MLKQNKKTKNIRLRIEYEDFLMDKVIPLIQKRHILKKIIKEENDVKERRDE